MRAASKALGQALLDHHRRVVAHAPPGAVLQLGQYTIRYGDLCSRAGLPDLTRVVGTFLQEVAEWCEEKGHPPLNAMAVNATGQPGEGYDGAGECEIAEWPKQLEACVRYTGYPAVFP